MTPCSGHACPTRRVRREREQRALAERLGRRADEHARRVGFGVARRAVGAPARDRDPPHTRTEEQLGLATELRRARGRNVPRARAGAELGDVDRGAGSRNRTSHRNSATLDDPERVRVS
ncbi:hypothetical protein DB32_001094 [Sandaracinus amylolyticus]|uniref:Uncharacterized protein n=1 Tax=Sandaracinus amylolyticus TaxID=927083 RepID=A0A0F6YFP7_9BACT|nr:hypothetical protein DB32_001094 [Sandaracinus amylolyticus]